MIYNHLGLKILKSYLSHKARRAKTEINPKLE